MVIWCAVREASGEGGPRERAQASDGGADRGGVGGGRRRHCVLRAPQEGRRGVAVGGAGDWPQEAPLFWLMDPVDALDSMPIMVDQCIAGVMNAGYSGGVFVVVNVVFTSM